MSNYSPRFLRIMRFIFKWECVLDRNGNVIAESDPDDPGGLTKYGIDKASHPKINISKLTLDQALNIYFSEWQHNECESLPFPLGEVYFNSCVNNGVSRANKIINTIKKHTAEEFLDAQEDFYRRLVATRNDLKKFLNGWLNRTKDLRKWVSISP